MSEIYECRCSFTTIWLFVFNNHTIRCKQPPTQFSCEDNLKTYRCTQCNFETFLKVDYHNHVDSHFACSEIPNKLEQCEEQKCTRCNLKTFSSFFYEVHRLTISCWATVINDNYVKCRECDKVVTSRAYLKSHVYFKHGYIINVKTMLQCPHCPFTTIRKRNLNYHVIRWHLNSDQIKWHKCDQCPFKAKLELQLKGHIERDHNGKQYSCEQCSYTTTATCYLKRHIERKHPLEAICLRCEECPYKTSDKWNLFKHVRYNHRTVDLRKCKYCSFTSKWKQNIKDHIITKHMDPSQIKWYCCELCPHKCKTNKLLTRHMRNCHQPNKEVNWYKCEQCDYKGRHKSDIIMHKRVEHSIIKKEVFTCDQCSYQTYKKGLLNYHWRKQHSDQWLQCDHCDYRTRSKSTLTTHYTCKHAAPENIKWHECPCCSYKSKLKSSLNRHMAQHERIK